MEAFKTSHDIGDEEFADAEANDPFVQNLILNLDQTFFSRYTDTLYVFNSIQ